MIEEISDFFKKLSKLNILFSHRYDGKHIFVLKALESRIGTDAVLHGKQSKPKGPKLVEWEGRFCKAFLPFQAVWHLPF